MAKDLWNKKQEFFCNPVVFNIVWKGVFNWIFLFKESDSQDKSYHLWGKNPHPLVACYLFFQMATTHNTTGKLNTVAPLFADIFWEVSQQDWIALIS